MCSELQFTASSVRHSVLERPFSEAKKKKTGKEAKRIFEKRKSSSETTCSYN